MAIKHTTPEDYYNPSNGNLGNYQYLKLSEIISDFELQAQDTSSYISGMPRSLLLRHAKSALKSLHQDVSSEVKALELTIGDDLTFPLPQDYVDYIRVSLLSGDNTLVPLDINRNLNTADTYLQDHKYEILFDNDGDVLEADGNNIVNKPYKSYKIGSATYGGNFQTDTSEFSKHGEFTINERKGKIYFSSGLFDKSIVLEYLSDGVEWERIDASEITYHKFLNEALNDLMYYRCIERRTNVPMNEKIRAKNQHKTSAHKAKIKLANFDLQAIKKAMRKSMKWVQP